MTSELKAVADDLVRQLGLEQHAGELVSEMLGKSPILFRRAVSGTYRNAEPAGSGRIIELRVDVDGSRPQNRLSGDVFFHFRFLGFDITFYLESFVVESPVVGGTGQEMTISGSVMIYGQPGRVNETIEVHIPRAWIFSDPPPACVNWLVGGVTTAIYACPKISERFRTATLEIDRFQGTVFPSELNPTISPSPSGLSATVSVRSVFDQSGIDLDVVLDDVLNDPDSPDPGANWSEVELHDLMETRFDSFSNVLQWRLYGVVVPRFGDPSYSSGYYGVMFDWGGYQPGDTFLRQGCAVAEEAIRGREVGTLYDTSAKKERLFLQTFIHEVGHSWNLPHTWQRTSAPSTASTSFMNYPWGYTGGAGDETAFWSNFRWAFDDVELRWMRHADRADVIFGGRDWIGNNLSRYLDPAMNATGVPVRIELAGPALVDLSEPVRVTLTVINDSPAAISLPSELSPEAGMVHVYIQRPDGEVVEHRPPVYRLVAPEDTVAVPPGGSYAVSIPLSFAATGPAFPISGEYRVRALLTPAPEQMLPSNSIRLRVGHPANPGVEELASVVTRPEVAKFLYFGGSVRHPEVAEELAEVAERHEKASPSTTRHLFAALGQHAARAAKHLDVRDGRRIVAVRDPDPVATTRYLERATRPAAQRQVFDDPTLAGLTTRLADAYVELGKVEEAQAALRRALQRVEAPNAKEQLSEKLQGVDQRKPARGQKRRSPRR
jgi:hypothetical protein